MPKLPAHTHMIYALLTIALICPVPMHAQKEKTSQLNFTNLSLSTATAVLTLIASIVTYHNEKQKIENGKHQSKIELIKALHNMEAQCMNRKRKQALQNHIDSLIGTLHQHHTLRTA